MQQVQAVVEHANDQNADNHAAGGSHAATHAGAAQHGRGYRVGLIAYARARLSGSHAGGQHNACHGRQKAAEAVDEDLHPVDIDASEAGSPYKRVANPLNGVGRVLLVHRTKGLLTRLNSVRSPLNYGRSY